MGMAETYTDNLHHQFENYYATWLPGTPLELGDYGEMKDHLFTKIGNISKDFGIIIEHVVDPTQDTYEYTSSGLVNFKFSGNAGANIGRVGKAEATVKISFSGKDAIFFFADKCKCNSITNIKSIGEEISKLRDWNKHHRIITEIIEAGATTVLISEGKDGEVTFGVKGKDISLANFASAGMKLSIKSQRFSGLKVITAKGLKPLFRVRKFRESNFIIHDTGFPIADKIPPPISRR